MATTTITSRELSLETGRAKAAAQHGPVFITDGGTPTHVLLSYREYRRLAGDPNRIIDLLGLPPGG